MRVMVAFLLLLLLCGSAYAQMGANLCPPHAADLVAVNSGSWQDASTWQPAMVPWDQCRTHIPAGITVTNHGATFDQLWCHVAGTLKACDHCSTTINAHTIYVPMGGSFLLHSTGQCIVEWTPGPFLPGDTTKLSRGLICHGEFMANGVKKAAWLDGTVEWIPVGATSFTLPFPPLGWNVGDRLVITGTDSKVGEANVPYQSEFVTVEAINGATVTFSPPLQYRHFKWRSDLPFHVANLSRNIVIRSRDTSTVENRGHLMFMSHMNRMDYVEMVGLGRTDKSQSATDPRLDLYGELVAGSDANPRARYADHVHRAGTLTPPAIRVGCVVDGSPGWGFLNHNSNVIYKDCVSLRCFGAGFATEEGQERGGWFNCLSLMNRGRGDTVASGDADHGMPLNGLPNGDWGSDGSGFWNHSGLMQVVDCVSADNSGRGFGQFIRTLNGYPRYGSGNPIPEYLRYPIEHHGTLLGIEYNGIAATPASTVPPMVFKGNTAYGNKVGYQGWSGPTHDSSSNLIWPPTVRGSITDLTLWGRGGKLHLEYTRQMNVDGLTIVGDRGFRPAYNSLSKFAEAVLLRNDEVTIRNWSIDGIDGVAAEFLVEGSNDPGGIAAKNIQIEGATVNADGSVTINN